MMEENDFTIEEKMKNSSKGVFLRILTNKSFLIVFISFIILIVLEFTTSFVEIILGHVVELTNGFRPKTGTVWERHEKDIDALDQLKEITQTVPEQKEEISSITDLVQLKTYLEEKETVLISAEQFLNLYNQIPTRFAFDIISPFDLLKLSHNRTWVWSKIVKSENSLSFYFLDGERQILMDSYPSLAVLYRIPQAENNHDVTLESMDMYRGRTFTAEQFFKVFDNLANQVKLRIINNPFQLLKWGNNIRKIGISRYIIDNTVNIGFEVNMGIYTEVFSFEADEFAIRYYLINELNNLYPELNLEYPEKKYRAYSDF